MTIIKKVSQLYYVVEVNERDPIAKVELPVRRVVYIDSIPQYALLNYLNNNEDL